MYEVVGTLVALELFWGVTESFGLFVCLFTNDGNSGDEE